ncbi:hypothetical protein LR48_Vigan503s002400 [Vigna angularis]|uniref:Uncharacterized protein n=1 Tax=Phaseolus angularis TaxID=3914 RepID=A0A0L9TD99_PHAAN|nr:hypothetical protein LR48_Vigan503s002400 [Vigna angularis]
MVDILLPEIKNEPCGRSLDKKITLLLQFFSWNTFSNLIYDFFLLLVPSYVFLRCPSFRLTLRPPPQLALRPQHRPRPRVRNIAPLLPKPSSGDGEFENQEERTLVLVQHQIHGKADRDGDVLSPVLYRDKLARTFNSRGFVKFGNLAKISRPNRNKKRKKRKEAMEVEDSRHVGQNSFVVVEVFEEEEEDSVGMRKLLGEEFVSSKWRGSTRLLLLDERFAGHGMDELPKAIKVVPLLFQ